MLRCRKGFTTIALMLSLLLALPLGGAVVLTKSYLPRIAATAAQVPQAPIGLVLGAAATETTLSTVLHDRVDTGIELLKAGRVNTLVMSGAPHEARAMKEYALRQGLKGNQVEADEAGKNTLASILNLRGKTKELTIVSQRYHLPRALFYAAHAGFTAWGLTADRHEYEKIAAFKERELLAIGKALVDVYWTRAVTPLP